MKAVCVAVMGLALAAAAPAPRVMSAQGGACTKAHGLFFRTAYVARAGAVTGVCPNLLSTQTIIVPRRWNKT
jgi:hypothetical protein